MSFGTYPLVTLADAREKRGVARKQVANGIDPVAEKKAQKLAQKLSVENSFEAISREWHTHKADRWTLAYREEIMRTFEQDVFPYVGQRSIAEIKPLELLEVLRRIEKRGALEKTVRYASAAERSSDTGKTLTRWPVFVDHFRCSKFSARKKYVFPCGMKWI